jgi:hypothetical protein
VASYLTDGLIARVAGHYALVLQREDTSSLEAKSYATLQELALAANRAANTHLWWRSPRAVAALSPSGKTLPLDELEAHGARLRAEESAKTYYPGYTRRCGPVTGVRCFRGGAGYSRRYLRRFHTAGERRLGALVLKEEGEVAPRCARNSRNLPNPWDDIPRIVERSWKSQHKGRKAWDRPEGKGARGRRVGLRGERV